MEQPKCQKCQSSISESSIFCGNCGTQLKCKSCKESLSAGVRFCESCGTEINKIAKSQEASNRIKFKENADGRTFEAEFTDPVGKDITETFGKIIVANQLRLGQQQFNGNQDKVDEQGTVNIDSKEIEVESEDLKKVDKTANQDFTIPDINNVKYLDLPKSESEWILVYAAYISEFKISPLNRKAILDHYRKTNRYTDSNVKNLSQNLKALLSNDKVRFVGNDEIVLTEDGLNKAKEIVGRTSGNTFRRKGNKIKPIGQDNDSSKKKTSSSQPLKLVPELDLHPKGKESLKEFYNKYEVKTFFEKNLIFCYYLQHKIVTPEIGLNQIYTCYKHVAERVPGNLYQSLADTKKSKGWIDTKDMNKVVVTVGGENAIEHDLKVKV